MKKITLLFLIISTLMFAQQPESYAELAVSNNEVITNSNTVEAVIERVDNGRMPIVGTYNSLADFNAGVIANCSVTTLISENFAGGPMDITDCGPTISSAGDGCFTAGELESGFNVQASNGTTTINIPPGAIGNTDSLVGATTFAEFTIVNFSPAVFAVAGDLWENNEPSTTVRIFGTGGILIDTFIVTHPTNTQTFYGFVSDELVTKVELEGAAGSGELFGNFLFGGICTPLSINENALAQVSIFPNPTSAVLNIKVPSTIEVQNAVLFDLLGKNTGVKLINGVMNTSDLARGVYILNLKTSAGTLTEKVIKN